MAVRVDEINLALRGFAFTEAGRELAGGGGGGTSVMMMMTMVMVVRAMIAMARFVVAGAATLAISGSECLDLRMVTIDNNIIVGPIVGVDHVHVIANPREELVPGAFDGGHGHGSGCSRTVDVARGGVDNE